MLTGIQTLYRRVGEPLADEKCVKLSVETFVFNAQKFFWYHWHPCFKSSWVCFLSFCQKMDGLGVSVYVVTGFEPERQKRVKSGDAS